MNGEITVAVRTATVEKLRSHSGQEGSLDLLSWASKGGHLRARFIVPFVGTRNAPSYLTRSPGTDALGFPGHYPRVRAVTCIPRLF